MIKLTFTKALVLYTISLTFLYLLLSLLRDEEAKRSMTKINSSIFLKFLIPIALLDFILLHFLDLKISLQSLHFLFIALLFFGLLFHLTVTKEVLPSSSIVSNALLVALLIHFIIVYNPPYGMYFGEWTGTYAKMLLMGHYTIEPHRYTYNPFPAHASILVILSEMTGILIIEKILVRLPSYVALIVIDLILFNLMRRLIKSWRLGILAILIYATTPPANFVDHIAKLASLMLIMTGVLVLILYSKEKRTTQMTNMVAIVIAYCAAIFYHATAGLGIFVLAGMVCLNFMVKNLVIRRSNKQTHLSKEYLPKLCLIVFTIVTLIKWGWGGGFRKIIPSLYHNFLAMIEMKPNVVAPAPLYERVGVDPLQAYPWSMPVAMALTFLLYALIKKKIPDNMLVLSLAVGGLLSLLLGFTSALLRTGFAASLYPGFAFIIPAAAMTVYKLLQSRKSIIIVVTITLLIFSALIASKDPMNMPGRWVKLKGFIIPGEEQYYIASSLYRLLPSINEKYLVRELIPPIKYIDPLIHVKGIIYEPTDPKYQKDYQLVQGNLKSNTIYVFRRNQIITYFSNGILGSTRVNVFLNYGKYLSICRAD